MSKDTTRHILDALQCERPGCICHKSTRDGRGNTHCPTHDDGNPSLSVSPPDRTAWPLLRCFAGCSFDAVSTALIKQGIMPAKTQYQIGAYVHHREDTPNGKAMTWHGGPKTAELLYPDGWADGLTPGTTVLLVEGEKACDATRSRGLVAVATVCGAGSTPTPATLQRLAPFDIVVTPDNDVVGRQHMERIATGLVALGCHPRWLAVPGLPDKGDMADYVGTDDDLAALVAAAPRWQATEHDEDIPPRRFRILSRHEFLALPEPEWLVQGVVPRPGTGLVYSPSGLGKSFERLHLACCIATGAPWFGREVAQGDVLYIACEGQAGFKKRLLAWESFYGIKVERLYWLADAPQLMRAKEVAAILEELALAGIRPVLIIIDTLARTLVGGDENSARDVGQYLASMERLKEDTGAHVSVVHHTGHNAQDRPRGSSTIMPAVDTLIALQGDPATHELQLVCEKQKDAAEFAPIALRLVVHNDSLVAVASEATAAGTSAAEQTLLEVLIDAGEEGLSTSAWMRALPGIPPRSFHRARKKLDDRGLLAKEGTEARPRWKSCSYTSAKHPPESPPKGEPQKGEERGSVPDSATPQSALFESDSANSANTANGAMAPSAMNSAMVPTPVGVAPLAQSALAPSVAPTECPVCHDYLDERFAVDGRHRSCVEFEAVRL